LHVKSLHLHFPFLSFLYRNDIRIGTRLECVQQPRRIETVVRRSFWRTVP